MQRLRMLLGRLRLMQLCWAALRWDYTLPKPAMQR